MKAIITAMCALLFFCTSCGNESKGGGCSSSSADQERFGPDSAADDERFGPDS